jgi:hypothetical protein
VDIMLQEIIRVGYFTNTIMTYALPEAVFHIEFTICNWLFIVVVVIIIIISLQPFVGPWPFFQFLDPIHTR